MVKRYTVYILKSELHDRFYIGQTSDIDKRFIRHNRGYVKFTKPYIPWSLVYVEEFKTRKESVSRELQLKRWKSKIKIKELIDASR